MDGTLTYWLDGAPVCIDGYRELSSWYNGAPFVISSVTSIHAVASVTLANIEKICGVAKADIEAIAGVGNIG